MSTFDALRERFPEKTDAEIHAAIAAALERQQQRQLQADEGFAGSVRDPAVASAQERSIRSPGWGQKGEHGNSVCRG